MIELQYNNQLGSGWVNWEQYKLDYAKIHGSSSFIENYPIERPHMFREIKYFESKHTKNTISLHDLFFKFEYKKFIKQQLYFMINPIAHIKELFKRK